MLFKILARNIDVQNLGVITTKDAAEKNDCLGVISQEHASNGWPFISWVFCRVHRALNCNSKGSGTLTSRVQSFMFLILFIPQSKLPHACLEVLLKSICTSIILSIRTVVEATVGEDPSHIRNEQSSSCVVASL